MQRRDERTSGPGRNLSQEAKEKEKAACASYNCRQKQKDRCDGIFFHRK
jgi:hypothetical protein